MPEKGFSVLTVKDQHLGLLRSCYRALKEGTGVPVVIDKDVYDKISGAVGRGEAQTPEDLIHAAVRSRFARGEVVLVIPERLVEMMRDLLKSEWFRKYHTPRSLEGMALRGIEQYLYRMIEHEIPKPYELVYQVAPKRFLVGELGISESVLTWTQVVGMLCWRMEPPRILEWRVRTKRMVGDDYHPYLGALFGGELYVVGGMARYSGTGGRAYRDAVSYAEGWELQLEVRPDDDPAFQSFLGSVKEFYKRPKAERARLTYSLQDIADRMRKE